LIHGRPVILTQFPFQPVSLLAHAIEELETGSAAEAWAVVQKAIPYSDENSDE